MPIQNICLFNAARSDSEYIGILNFVYEKNCGTYKDFGVISVFRLHLVTSGSGSIDTSYKREKLSVGDVFLTFPGTEYRINDEDNLQYIYISFVGIRAHKLLDRVGINKRDFVRTVPQFIQNMWQWEISQTHHYNIDLVAEGVLLTTLGNLCNKSDSNELSETGLNVLSLKKQAEDRYMDPSFNLQTACKEIYYNPKYASAAFKRYMGMGFNEYLLSLRLNNATRLIESGISTVKQIAELSGFSDALYFSRVYKKKWGCAPTVSIAKQRNKQPTENISIGDDFTSADNDFSDNKNLSTENISSSDENLATD